MQVCERHAEPWKVTLVDTGDATMTGGRLKRVAPHIRDEQSFCLTYGDGVANINITEEIAFHHQHGKLATVAAVQPPGRYGALQTTDARVTKFMEKPAGDGGLINGGFFVLSPKCLELIEGDDSSWEDGPLMKLAEQGELMAFEHRGFWRPMDTLRDKNQLEEFWASGVAPWKIW
jgi:glucose-1-phosphate cytidylyltransferase